MDDSLPVLPASEQELQDFLTHRLKAIKSKDVSSTRPPRTIGLRPTYDQAKAFSQKLLQRLPATFCSQFFDVVEQTISEKSTADKPHVAIANMFAEANELGLWQEYLDLFMPHWKGEQKIEESEMEILETMLGNRSKGKQ